MLGGALTGGGTWHRPADAKRTVLNGMLAVLIDPDKLGTRDAFEREATAFVEWLRQSPASPGFERVQIAGEPERETKARRLVDGIPVDSVTWGEIVGAGAKVGLAADRIEALAHG